MCAISGILKFDSEARVEESQISAMLRAMRHRGPDSSGIHLDANVGLGNNRLSIIDLCTGDQPMTNEDGSVWIVFNGEIYNYLSLREHLSAKGHCFKTKSDTEVIIHAYEEYGLDCVQKLRGMFVFAIWDKKNTRLFIARDRVGIKPLYYYQSSSAFYFASELKAIIADSIVPREINYSGLRTFFSFYYLPGAETLLKGVYKLLPGYYLIIENGKISQKQYWDLRYSRQRWNVPYEEAGEELFHLLAQSVREHMIADVPVGLLLSGGVDSSAMLSYAVQETGKKVKTFTVGFGGGDVVDERPYARAAAAKFGSDHYEINFSAQDFWSFLPNYVWHMEDPVCEPPAVALYYLTKLASRHVKVVLSGEGGDEAFGGYPDYPTMLQVKLIENTIGPLSRSFGQLAAWFGFLIGDARFTRCGYACGRPLSEHYFSRTSTPMAYFNRRAHQIFSPDFLQASVESQPSRIIDELLSHANPQTFLDQMLYIDAKTWLPDDILIKADKITMANSVELRVPLLNHEVLEFAASLPPYFKVDGKDTKRLLKSTFARILPMEVLTRKKAGFPVPYRGWLAKELAEPIREVLLAPDAFVRTFSQTRNLIRCINEHCRSGSLPKEIFSLLVIEHWVKKFLSN